MKTKKSVSTKAVEKKVAKRSGMAIKSQLKAGNFWEDLRAVYAPEDRMKLPA